MHRIIDERTQTQVQVIACRHRQSSLPAQGLLTSFPQLLLFGGIIFPLCLKDNIEVYVMHQADLKVSERTTLISPIHPPTDTDVPARQIMKKSFSIAPKPQRKVKRKVDSSPPKRPPLTSALSRALFQYRVKHHTIGACVSCIIGP